MSCLALLGREDLVENLVGKREEAQWFKAVLSPDVHVREDDRNVEELPEGFAIFILYNTHTVLKTTLGHHGNLSCTSAGQPLQSGLVACAVEP